MVSSDSESAAKIPRIRTVNVLRWMERRGIVARHRSAVLLLQWLRLLRWMETPWPLALSVLWQHLRRRTLLLRYSAFTLCGKQQGRCILIGKGINRNLTVRVQFQ